MAKQFYCQTGVEGEKKCKTQCRHCKAYYAPVKEDKNKKPKRKLTKNIWYS